MSQDSNQAALGSIGVLTEWQFFDQARAKNIALALGVVLILAANFFLRYKLEHTPVPPYTVFPDNRVPLSWKLLLPVDMGEATDNVNYKNTYHWFTTGTTIVKLLEECFSPKTVFYTLNATLIICTFMFSWWMFHSAIFSYTLTFCMAFGTQFHWLYLCSPVESMYLFVIYMEANLLFLMKVLQSGRRLEKAGYVLTLVLLALCHEQWLDYFGFLILASVFLLTFSWRAQNPKLRTSALFVLLASCLIVAIYLSIRMSYGRQQFRPGHESEMIFTYQSPILMVEDFLSNIMTYIYIAISNYFPPFMLGSNSLYHLGAQKIIAEQHGYHEAQTHLVAMHHLFYWYFWAGIVFAIFAYFLVRNAKIALQNQSVPHVHLSMAMLMIACGFAIHSLIKYRPYLSAPFLTYKCMTSTVGASYLLAYCIMYGQDWLVRWKSLRWTFVLLVWSVIVYGAIARPAYISHLSRQVGMGELPDPRRNLRLPRFLRTAETMPLTDYEECQEPR